jgi:ppGpp synthetase/RelA/SpoT-type nucleotidyltranferase
MGPEGIDLKDFKSFVAHDWVHPLVGSYKRAATLAKFARTKALTDLDAFNQETLKQSGRVAFTTIEGRIKEQISFFRKLHKLCVENAQTQGLTPQTLESHYNAIKDLCGIRFSCPYFDEVAPAIKALRERLSNLGYATDLRKDPKLADKDFLEDGDAAGYRSYHFYIEVPTPVDIYGNVQLCLCEVQVRTELQHVWAVKSHDLLYKPGEGWSGALSDKDVLADMKHLSNSLRSADQSLISIRNRAKPKIN